MKHKKAVFFSVIGLLMIIGVIYILNYNHRFNVKNDEHLTENIEEWLSRGNEKITLNNHVKLHQLGNSNSYIGFLQFKSKKLGIVKLDKGWNGKFQIIFAGYGTNDLKYQTVNSKDGRFGVVYGSNPQGKIHFIKVELLSYDYQYSTNINSNQDFFMKIDRLPKAIKSNDASENIITYDQDHKEIKVMQK